MHLFAVGEQNYLPRKIFYSFRRRCYKSVSFHLKNVTLNKTVLRNKYNGFLGHSEFTNCFVSSSNVCLLTCMLIGFSISVAAQQADTKTMHVFNERKFLCKHT